MEGVELRYKAKEIKLNLAQIRRRPIPTRTWEFWKARLHIRPDTEGFYTHEDFNVLKGLIKALSKGWTIQQYINWYNLQEDKNNANRQRSATQTTVFSDPIEVTAVSAD